MKKAILSVSNKSGIVAFAQSLNRLGYELFSTGGTMRTLVEADVPVKSISELTQFEEIMDGRVKTLHPSVHGGILADRDKPEHLEQLKEQHIDLIDIVVVNLYPFKETVANPEVTQDDAIENIDIGGPTMLRAAAKNFKHVTTVVHPADYNEVIDKLENDTLDEAYRKSLMVKVFDHTNQYDAAIVEFFKDNKESLRYGENPQQSAHFVRTSNATHTLAGAKQLHGKQLSYNNIKDADAALSLVKQFEQPAAVAVKHMNPCGVGVANTIEEAYQYAFEADSQSIFGGIVALNRTVDTELAESLHEIFLEVVIAPKFTQAALDVLSKKKNIRLLEIDMTIDNSEQEVVSVSGGYLVQDKDNVVLKREDMNIVTEVEPTEAQWDAMLLGWKVVASVKSNAVILSNAKQTVGIGAGQMNRVGSAQIAIDRALEINEDVVMVSDGFFPMGDTVELAAKSGIKAIIQPGGSIKDQESIDMANKYGVAMVTTGVRHFKH
ncbi:bifunctional phosphoribosylaminoimidazolecarboxamide formyltransferase/IMP cyclohydrolase PurH [Staphylococcus succinus]|jgi:phosphoribosylaminoimidazolecarboxamide formyltransferase/IMP cyclohydrolase|uniref:Bifunctional purine biosynthesis protein PurH n=1 Tax=Staphylococcus succinus TaxID=61015 RepID=A0A9Q6MUY8_9STAP|nr:bifunctional phosphoribosylaminoimidazolecarboxamide formyltransferase/IMP cyclohydrolase [Staphylococcus succinus]MEB8209776.1 bifunctional phosphoribosylaminoimidazolecarboxamide formyltransferase/IMP cyclohydrolase [Staphylococcus succinus]PTI75335.1 bifunctional phosphoribosylaminoimidazolecarboxamide formyltransferase/inosine monophosphate cyclohydrolase [Staphylococcus succinus]RIN31404.1 bifunctional phosphoribosylaminoimidazolecarboxamide formyltransferase/IMP cyclohydrolase PurH [Sta